MGKSAAFARIKNQVLSMTFHIPAGQVSTYRSLAEHIDVMPIHVAYILTMLSLEEKDRIPWHRVVSESGVISSNSKFKTSLGHSSPWTTIRREQLARRLDISAHKIFEFGIAG
jgi:alkylated DNA nucleotide flippase Atl1